MIAKIREFFKAKVTDTTEAEIESDSISDRQPETSNQQRVRIPGEKFVYLKQEWVYLAAFWSAQGTYYFAIYAGATGAQAPKLIPANEVTDWLPFNETMLIDSIQGLTVPGIQS